MPAIEVQKIIVAVDEMRAVLEEFNQIEQVALEKRNESQAADQASAVVKGRALEKIAAVQAMLGEIQLRSVPAADPLLDELTSTRSAPAAGNKKKKPT